MMSLNMTTLSIYWGQENTYYSHKQVSEASEEISLPV